MIKTPIVKFNFVSVFFPDENDVNNTNYRVVMNSNIVLQIMSYKPFMWKIKKDLFYKSESNRTNSQLQTFLTVLYNYIESNNAYIKCNYISNNFLAVLYNKLNENTNLNLNHKIFDSLDLDYIKLTMNKITEHEYYFPK
jgi:hypothetical protein